MKGGRVTLSPMNGRPGNLSQLDELLQEYSLASAKVEGDEILVSYASDDEFYAVISAALDSGFQAHFSEPLNTKVTRNETVRF